MSQLGAQSFEQMKKSNLLVQMQKTNAYVRCVANSITQHIPKQGFSEWESRCF